MADRIPVDAIFGLAEPEPAPREVAAGDFSFTIADGALRGISFCGTEIVRAIDCPIRDPNWGTCSQTGVREELNQTGAAVEYRRSFNIDGDQLSGVFTVSSDGAGTLTAGLVLRASRDFTTNRAGFTLLHPIAGVAGHKLTVTHPDGAEEVSRFPETISAAQPVFDIRAMRHRVGAIDVLIEFSGEIFEMEDQRNWTDASYKTYCRPLRLPMPYVIGAGDTVTQEIRISANAVAQTGGKKVISAPEPARWVEAKGGQVCPDILLAAGRDWIGDDAARSGDFAGAQGIVARLEDHETGDEDWVGNLLHQASRHSAICDFEIVIPEGADPARHLAAVAGNFSALGLEPRHVVALPAAYMRSYQPDGDWPQGTTPDACARAAEKAFPKALIGVGMLTNFTEVNRCRPKPGAGSYLTFGTTAIVHAADDRSVLETLEALPHLFATARTFIGDRDIRLGLVAIGMRTNPYGAGVAPNPEHKRLAMAMDDPRQHGLFAASFAVAATAIAAAAGCGALALAAPGGPFSMTLASEDPTPNPLAHGLRGLSRLAGKPFVALENAPPSVYANAARGAVGLEGVITNASLAPVRLDFDQPIAALRLDQNAVPAARSAGWWSQPPQEPVKSLIFGPCETVFFTSRQAL